MAQTQSHQEKAVYSGAAFGRKDAALIRKNRNKSRVSLIAVSPLLFRPLSLIIGRSVTIALRQTVLP